MRGEPGAQLGAECLALAHDDGRLTPNAGGPANRWQRLSSAWYDATNGTWTSPSPTPSSPSRPRHAPGSTPISRPRGDAITAGRGPTTPRGSRSHATGSACSSRAAGRRSRGRAPTGWTSHADIADWCFLLCRTEPEAPKHKGLSLLLIDMRSPGVSVRPLRQMTGEAEFSEVFFDGVEVPADRLVGIAGAGWQIAMGILAHER